MKVIVRPSLLRKFVHAPASKSSMQRACAAAYLKRAECVLYNPGYSNDDKAALQIIRDLGAEVELLEGDRALFIRRGSGKINQSINCGESGLSVRMFIPIIALNDQSITITGEGSLMDRPMDAFDEVLPQLGVSVQSDHGKLPVVVKGPLIPKNIEVDGSLSSQFLTGLLMAYAGANATDVTIKVKNLKSRPYIDLTLSVIRQFRLANIENRNYQEFYFKHTEDENTDADTINDMHKKEDSITKYMVEADWSGGAFLLVAGAIAGPIQVKGLDLTSTQADKVIVDAMIAANAGIAMHAKGINVRPAPMNAFDFDATDCPDLFPPLVALAAYCDGQSKIKGVSRLTHKESNRAITLKEEFEKMNVQIELNDDVMIIHGGKGVKGAAVRSHHDHRIAMACAVAALKAEGTTTIEGAEAIKKSYPDFYKDLKSLGADIHWPGSKIKL